MTEKNYWQTLDKCLRPAKENIPSQCRIGGTYFTSISVIGGKLYSNNIRNTNHVHKDSKDLVSVIINLGTNISGGDIVFYDGVKQTDLGKISHVLKHLHGRIIMGPFERCFNEGYLWRGHRVGIYFILKKIVCISFVVGVGFITNI